MPLPKILKILSSEDSAKGNPDLYRAQWICETEILSFNHLQVYGGDDPQPQGEPLGQNLQAIEALNVDDELYVF
jgi:hypothetical protein